MSSLKKRPRSPYWWLKWRNPSTGKVEEFSTKHRYGLARESAKARELRAEYALKELRAPRTNDESRWDHWVDAFLQSKFATSPASLARYRSGWRYLHRYLIEQGLLTPAHVGREHAQNYFTWRKSPSPIQNRKSQIKNPVNHNTILQELKILSGILSEAVNRQWLQYNPCHRLGFKKGPVRWKTEMSDADIAVIRAEVARRGRRAKTKDEQARADFFHVSFEIALAQTFRLAETCFALSDVDFENRTVTLTLKGGKREVKDLNPSLLPLLRRLQAEGRTHTYERPRMASLCWFKLFDRLRASHPGMANMSFHSTRVTGISRAERAGVPEAVMMHQANHASTTVHRVYRRVKQKELSAIWKALPQ